MALPGPSRYQKQAAARRKTSDITRLANQYQRNVQAMTQEYETAFSAYQQQTAEKLAPYEQQLEKYQAETFPIYEQQAEAYRQKIQGYENTLKAYEQYRNSFFFAGSGNTPTTVVKHSAGFSTGSGTSAGGYTGAVYGDEVKDYQFVRTGTQPIIETKIGYRTELRGNQFTGYYYVNIPYSYQTRTNFETGYLKKRLETGEFTSLSPEQFQIRSQPGKFSEQMPLAPEAPTPPQLDEFDASQFEARRGQLETEFKRELGERRSARQRAVSRGGARPLLQGAA